MGENFVDLAPYINDARSLALPLLGGNIGADAPYGFHDWEYILKESGLIHHDHLIAALSNHVGIMLMVCALVWGALVLFKQYKQIRRSGRKQVKVKINFNYLLCHREGVEDALRRTGEQPPGGKINLDNEILFGYSDNYCL